MTLTVFGFIILLFNSALPGNTAVHYRLCATDRVNLLNRCEKVTKGDSQVECINVTDSVDCALKMQQGLVDFGVFTAEEALLASKFIDKYVQVVADVRHIERLTDQFAFQAVAVVKSTYEGTLATLRGSHFCHPGFAPGQLWTDAVLKYFERLVVPTPCDENLSVFEQETKALSTYFNTTCRPGTWVQDDKIDNMLKMKYENLCNLCDSPKTCSYASHETSNHRAALNCLTHRGGNITYVALRHVRQYFGLETDYSPMANINDFKFLCPSGNTEPLDTPSPCAWVQQPWSAVLARKAISMALQPLLLKWLNTTTSAESTPLWQQAFSELLLESDHTINSVTSLLPNFVRQSVETKQTCGKSVKWCTCSQSEERKCEWLRAAVQSHGLRPSMDCVVASSVWDCWAMVRNGTASVVTSDTEYGYITRRSYSLSPFAYLDSGFTGNFQILAIINSSNNKQIQNWSNVKHKRACFPEFGGLAWISTVSTLVDNNQLANCPYVQSMASYFSGACAPGAKDPEHIRGSGAIPSTLCSVCSTFNSSEYCSTTASSVFYGDLGALRCLSSGSGDIAFVDYRQLLGTNGDLAQDIDSRTYRVLCRNGSLADTLGLTVENDCALAHGVGSEIMARADRSVIRDLEITELLLEMDQWFGSVSPSKMDSVFHMYSEFQGNKDLLFKDSTKGIVLPNDLGYSYVNNYKELQEKNSICVKHRSNGVLFPPSMLLLILVFTVQCVI